MTKPNRDDDTFTRELMEAAGPPPPVPSGDLAAIKDAARVAWRQRYSQRGTRFGQRRWLMPLAATLVIGVAVATWTVRRAEPVAAPVFAGRMEKANGIVLADGQALTAGQALMTGALLETQSQSQAALRLTGGQSLRLDAGSRVLVRSASVLELQQGALYVDSRSADRLTIRTPFGAFTPVGTQFEVRLGEGTARLRVREGRVLFSRAQTSATLSAGEELLVHEDGALLRSRVAAHHASWDWVVTSAPMPPIEGRSLHSFVAWLAREKGWIVRYADAAAEARSRSAVLHGSVETLDANAALQVVTLSSGFTYRVEGGELVLESGE